MNERCHECDLVDREVEAVYKLTLTDLDGNLLDKVLLCQECFDTSRVAHVLCGGCGEELDRC